MLLCPMLRLSGAQDAVRVCLAMDPCTGTSTGVHGLAPGGGAESAGETGGSGCCKLTHRVDQFLLLVVDGRGHAFNRLDELVLQGCRIHRGWMRATPFL